MGDLPAKLLPDNIVDQVAREVAAEVVDHIETMYPEAAKVVAWRSASRSIAGVVRNTMNWAGRAAEQGDIEHALRTMRQNRLKLRQLRRQSRPLTKENPHDT